MCIRDSPNDGDAFPDDPFEYADLDGDGVGDLSDEDSDGDGVNDDEDFLPFDASIGVDGDGDGTPDALDSSPADPGDSRFRLAEQRADGAAAVVLSGNALLPGDLSIQPMEISSGDPILDVALSPVFEFEIGEEAQQFESCLLYTSPSPRDS